MASSEFQLAIVDKFDQNHDQDQQANKNPIAKKKSPKGGWNAAIFIIRKSPCCCCCCCCFYFFSLFVIFHFFGDILFLYNCSGWDGWEICLLWISHKSDKLPHKWAKWTDGHGGEERQHLGWSNVDLAIIRSFCCWFFTWSLQHYSFCINNLLHGNTIIL